METYEIIILIYLTYLLAGILISLRQFRFIIQSRNDSIDYSIHQCHMTVYNLS